MVAAQAWSATSWSPATALRDGSKTADCAIFRTSNTARRSARPSSRPPADDQGIVPAGRVDVQHAVPPVTDPRLSQTRLLAPGLKVLFTSAISPSRATASL